ncbi:putative aldouronate transport system substrate-binding protein [Anaerocolumna jejuensis DSM 15929]|uniref:Putative aldouronate transport system substrate-binding protein n=1 Tax=Anaerocolumna jejuensis DSM 15929 TaxID=1121322 RepID=A0A1M6V133_9FIRM|nr:extracellular solute-binding protein [Anaerocolumna jejuensis]SHK75016.1 putative aldouronate transport system substrate-binding protein [Anaerocolumna jejuensis DSM 15929]
MKKVLGLLLIAVMMMSLLAGCKQSADNGGKDSGKTNGSSNTSGDSKNTDTSSSEPVKLIYVVPGDAPADLERGLKAVNEKLAADGVGVEIELKYYAWDVWDQKLNIMLSTGEEFDMFHVMNDRVSLANYASRGALADLTPYMDQYGSAIKAANPELAMKSGQVGGKQYGIPAYWVESALDHQATIRTDILKKYNLDMPTTFEELTSAFETVMKNWDGAQKPFIPMVGTEQVGGYFFNSDNNYVLYDKMFYVGQDGSVKNYFETDAFKESCKKARIWYEKGLINPDVLTVTQDQKDNQLTNGDWFVHAGTIGDITGMKKSYPDITPDDFAWLDFDTATPEIRPYGTRNIQAVPLSSKHPEAAVKFINWLYSSQENFDLFVYGTEGTDYKKLDDRNYEAITDAASGQVPYSFATWMIGNINFEYTNSTAPKVTNEHLYNIDKTAVEGYASQFTFDGSNVQTQLADVNTQIAAVIAPMACGVVDYDSSIKEALNLLKKAGIDDLVNEFKSQLETSRQQ